MKDIMLFENIKENEINSVLKCLNSRKASFKNESIVFMTGDNISSVGIILSGEIQIIKEDYLGNKNILALLKKGDIFGESFVCAGINEIPVTVLAVSDCEIIFIEYKKIINTCSSNCNFHAQLIENMIKIISKKNIILNKKIDVISKRTIREKLISYFLFESEKSKKNSFEINFSRMELANYICVDRSAMIRELAKMKSEGIINFEKRFFEVNFDKAIL